MTSQNTDNFLSGEQIKAIRQKHGLSQQEFGSRLGVTHAHISKIESGKENPSETLLRLIKYEFKIDKLVGIPTSDLTKPQIKKYLEILSEFVERNELSDGTLYNTEFLFAALVTLYQSSSKNPMYLEMLTESVSGIIDEISQFLEATQTENPSKESSMLKKSKFLRLKREINDSVDTIFSLLEERIK